MTKGSKVRVNLTDHMVLLGFGLAAVYWVLDSILYVFMDYRANILYRFFGVNLSEVWTRIVVTCLFVIFGSHAQFTINKRRIVEEELQQSEEKYRTIIESIEDGYFEISTAGFLTFFNRALQRILGHLDDSLMGRNLIQLLDADSEDNLVERFQRMVSDAGAASAFDSTVTTPAGERRHLETTISPILDQRQRVIGYRGILRDVTQRRIEEGLKQEKLAAEAASRAKSEFLANMSHEIRTPLNSIIGLVELVKETTLTGEQREDLDVVSAASYALLAIINDILDFSKIEAGKLELESTAFDIRALIGESMKIMASKAHEKGLELAHRIDRSVPTWLTGDPTRFRQIIINLVSNAIKFTDAGEVILTITGEAIGEDGVRLKVSVRDTGAGIPADKQKAIFGAFAQADGSTTRKYGGTGLGLAVSSQLVGLMSGEIWVDSAPNAGSDFQFTSLFAVAEDKPQWPDDVTLAQLKGSRVLILDDNEATRHILHDILHEWGMTPDMAATRAEAQALLAAGAAEGAPHDVLLLDVEMPGDEGLHLARELAEIESDDTPKRILMAPYSRLRASIDMKKLGVIGSITKPVRLSELIDHLLLAMTDGSWSAPEKETPADSPTAPMASLSILVAEDTPFNQKFIARLLGRWRHRIQIVENGKEAVAAFKENDYDAVLMDVQMPIMDGLTATRNIRRIEAEQQRPPIPIIAMTAHAMKGDQEMCLEAGMDAYVSKPIASNRLRDLLAKLVPGTTGATTPVTAPSSSAMTFDKSALLRAFDHDWEFFAEAVDMFLEDYPPMVEEIKAAVDASDAQRLRRQAHALKGMLGNFQASAAVEAALVLEDMGRDNHLENAEGAVSTLSAEVKQVEQALVDLLKASTNA